MTVDVRPKKASDAIAELARRLYVAEQQSSRPSGGGSGSEMGVGTDPVVNTITIGGIVVGSPASPATNLVLTTGSFMDDTWIDADWDPPADGTAASYDVELAKKVGATYELVQNYHIGGGTSLRMPGVEPQQTYGVRVTAINRIDARSTRLPSSGFQDVVTGIDATIPGQVTGLTVTSGIRSITVRWSPVTDKDVALGSGTYEIQLSFVNTFTAGFTETRYDSGTIVAFGDLTTGSTYYVRVRAIDNSGNAGAYSLTGSATLGSVQTSDVGDTVITTAKIDNLAVTNAKIANLAVDDAKIANLDAAKITAGTIDANRIAANSIDVNKLTASTLTSKTITIGAGGVLKIGNAPTTGILINDQGIRLYSGGGVKVALDVAGTASFEGNISASTITSSTLTSATINSGTITGTTIRTAASGQRVALEVGAQDRVKLYTGSGNESEPGSLQVGVGTNLLQVSIQSPRATGGHAYSAMTLSSYDIATGDTQITWRILNSDGTEKAHLRLLNQGSGETCRLDAGGGWLDQLFLNFVRTGTNAQLTLRGSGDYAFIHFFGGGFTTTLNAVAGLGSGLHVLDGNNGSFHPLQASAFNVASARSVKRNVSKETRSALDRVDQMRVVRFNRMHDEDLTKLPPHMRREWELQELGFIADEVFEIFPEAVLTDGNGDPRSINLSMMTALAIKAIQELKERLP